MLQLKNQTPFQATIGVFANEDGVECAYGIAKATFSLQDGIVELAAKQDPIVPVDEFHGDPITTSLRSASEMTLSKPSTDILLQGHAYPASDRSKFTDVSLTVGELGKTVRVFGDRTWVRSALGYKATAPKAFDKMPLVYELAFGGTDSEPKNEDKIDYDPRNPVGKGLVARRSHRPIEDVALPNLEDPANLISSPNDRPSPACFAPTCAHWEPRKSYAGTYDVEWQKKRAPYLPEDFDSRFFQCAAEGMVSDRYIKGGETVEIVGATPGAL